MKRTRGILSAVLIPLFSILNTSVAAGADLDIPTKWLPSNTQNGQIVTTAVRVFVHSKEPFKDPRSGKMTYQNKAVVLRQEGKETSDTSAWLYLNTTNSLPPNATLRVTGLLSISEQQIKGGEYPATINVQSWEGNTEFSTKENQSSSPTLTIDDALLTARKYMTENRIFAGNFQITSAVLHDQPEEEKAYWEIILRKKPEGTQVTHMTLRVYMNRSVERTVSKKPEQK